MTYVQEPPFSVQLEPTEGCNLRCSYCGIAGIREVGTREDLSGPYLFMSPATARKVARDMAAAGWNPRVEFAVHGEPTLNPSLNAIVRAVRDELPKVPIMLTTNGIPLLTGSFQENVLRLFDSGVDTIAVDDYRPYKCREAVLNVHLGGVTVIRYPEDPAGNPHRRPKKGEKRLVLVKDIGQAEEGTHSHLSNHAGAGAPLDYSMTGKRCALPFRELTVRWDGNVALCCNDWRGAYKIGSGMRASVVDLWQSEPFMAARRILLNEGRTFSPCEGCTHQTYRNGLLPDKFGKKKLPMLARDPGTAAAATAGPSYTIPVQRKWEVQ